MSVPFDQIPWPGEGDRLVSRTAIRGKDPKRTLGAPLNDRAIRQGLLAKPLRGHVLDANTLVIHELGLVHARRRIDLAVINGTVHGFEIKSAVDGLGRLAGQLETYSQSLQKLTLVVADRNVGAVLERVPSWCGVLRASRGPRGTMRFDVLRRTRRRTSNRSFWHISCGVDEVRSILAALGAGNAELCAPRAVLYRALVDTIGETQLMAHIRAAMERRRLWRDLSRPSLCGG